MSGSVMGDGEEIPKTPAALGIWSFPGGHTAPSGAESRAFGGWVSVESRGFGVLCEHGVQGFGVLHEPWSPGVLGVLYEAWRGPTDTWEDTPLFAL